MEYKKVKKKIQEKVKKKNQELDEYHKETKKRDKEHFWAYDEHYQRLIQELSELQEYYKGLKYGYRLK